MVQVLQFRRRFERQPGWTQQELAEFYRVESALTQAGVKIVTDQGISDEGDPWFVFCRPDTAEVIVHFARLGDEFIIDGFGYERPARGSDFGALVRELISGDLFAVTRPKPKNSNVFLHPAALLIILVGTAFLHSGQAKAAEAHDKSDERRPHGLVNLLGSSASAALPLDVDPVQAAALVAGAILAFEQQALITPLVTPSASAETAPRGMAVDAAAYSSATVTAPAATPNVAHDAGLPSAAATTVAMLAGVASTAAFPPTAFISAESAIQLPTAATPVEPSAIITAPFGGLAAAAGFGALEGLLVFGARPAALPADQAGDLLRGVVSTEHPVLTLNGALPGLVLGLIEHGLHVTAGGGSPGEGSSHAGQPSAPQTSSAPSAGPLTGVVGSPDASGAPAALPHPHDPAIDAAVAHFISIVPHWEVLTTGRDIVVYDASILAPLGAPALDGVTFTFSDGSSVSLVGTATELVSAHILH
jgi:hypothetical protein